MYLYLIKKFFASMITMFLVTIVVFSLFQIVPGDPILAKLGETADPALEAALRSEYGLDKPVPVRYLNWLSGLLHGDLGISIRYTRPVGALIAQRLPVTVSLALLALLMTMAVGIPAGVLAARGRGKKSGFAFNLLMQIGMAIPPFYVAMMLILIFCIKLGLLPVIAYVPLADGLGPFLCGLLLPAVSVSLGAAAVTARYTRSSFLDQMGSNYVRTAVSNGIPQPKVLYGYVLRNALVPIVTILGLLLVSILTGSMVVEAVFSIPGIGSLLFDAINGRDFPLAEGITVYISAVVVFGFFVLDALYGMIDPRIRLQGGTK